LASKYEELDQLLKRNDIKLTSLVEKNLDFHEKQLTFMENAVEDTILTKLDSSIYRYDQLMIQLMPNGGLQERTYSPIQLLNEKGQDLLVELLQVPYEFNGKHHVVSI
ncbi:MAG: bacillithiol biosynthesis BshC, partial [Psychrobacillus sp.]